jgi:hypothetical protein
VRNAIVVEVASSSVDDDDDSSDDNDDGDKLKGKVVPALSTTP